MCCFSRPVEFVADTKIFARDSQGNRQFLVYAMKMSAKEDLAMILPLPVPKASPDDALRFINLEKYPEFFNDLANGLPVKKSESRGPAQGLEEKPKLKVVEVGSFEASFVPTVKDFTRLDERFRLPTEVWDKLPSYKEAGFAVFKLKSGAKDVHPMGFEFPRANPKQLFFPTVHIHDGKVHPRAGFDHALFCQSHQMAKVKEWVETTQPAGMFMKMDKAQGLLDPKEHCYFKALVGTLKNEDMLV